MRVTLQRKRCFLKDQSKCKPEDHPYYEVTHNGLVGVILLPIILLRGEARLLVRIVVVCGLGKDAGGTAGHSLL